MAKTVVDITDQIIQWMNDTNAISADIGDILLLNTTIDSDIVGALNSLKSSVDLLIAEPAIDSAATTTISRESVSVNDTGGDGSLGYNSGTGVFTYAGPVASEVRAHLSAGTGITYNSGTGIIGNSITQYTDSLARASVSAGTGISYSSATGIITNTITRYEDSDAKHSISVNDTGGSGFLTYDPATGIFTYAGGTDSAAIADTRAAVSATDAGGDGSFGYNSGTGVFTYTGPNTTSIARTSVSATDAGGDGSFGYNSGTGVFTYTGPSASETRAHLSAGTGITYSSATGVIGNSITQYTNSLARSAVSVTDTGGDGALAYSSASGVFTYTGPSAAETRAHLSGGSGITYSSGTGIISNNITQYTNSLARASVSVTDAGGDGSLGYVSGTGVFTYTGPSASETRAHFAAGTSLTLSAGTFSVTALGIDTGQINTDAVTSAKLASLSTLLIKNSAGTTLKTMHAAGA